MKANYLILISLVAFFSCNQPKESKDVSVKSANTTTDPLPSWNETPTKIAILDFVKQTTTEGGDKYIPAEDRIATFDNDGTLWCEQPLYFEMVYSIDATKAIASQSAELMKKPEIKALVSGDMKTFMQTGEKGILEAFAISHSAVKPEQFGKMAQAWLDTTMHPKFKQKYTDLTYKPMVELLQYLRDNEFKTFIVSGGSSMFIRQFSQKAYGIPAEQVIGTMFKAQYVETDKDIVLKPEVWHMDDNVGKPEAIYQIIGKKPVLAFGNSDGDLQMLQYTSTNTLPNLSLILHHTDAEREYAYDKDSHIGKLDKALTEGQAKGWIIVDMKKDFNKVFSYEK